MPYASDKQKHFMEACRHGWKPSRKGVKCPPKKVTKEYAMAEALRKKR